MYSTLWDKHTYRPQTFLQLSSNFFSGDVSSVFRLHPLFRVSASAVVINFRLRGHVELLELGRCSYDREGQVEEDVDQGGNTKAGEEGHTK